MITNYAPEVAVAREGSVLNELRAAGGDADIVNQRFASNISLRKALETPPTVRSLALLLQQQGHAA